jgi:hypothetical protein
MKKMMVVLVCDRCGRDTAYDLPSTEAVHEWGEVWPATVTTLGYSETANAIRKASVQHVCRECLTQAEADDLCAAMDADHPSHPSDWQWQRGAIES